MWPGKLSWIPRNQKLLLALVVMTSMVDSVLVGFDSSLMGSLNVMPSYTEYFTLTKTTKSLNTAISYVGGCVCTLFAGFLVDWRGRKECVFWSAAISIVGGAIQGGSVKIGMFIVGRFIVGFGLGLAQTSTPTLVAECVPPESRGFALGVYYAFWNVGTLIASGVCYGTQNMTSTWAWRIPSLLQIAPGLVCMVIILFVPESPRWLIAHDRTEEALLVLSRIHGVDDDGNNGHVTNSVVQQQFHTISETLAWEKSQRLNIWQAMSHPASRKKLEIVNVFSLIVMLPGTNIIVYYFGDMLSNAGVSDPTTQLQINVILTAWTLVVAVLGSWFADKTSRKLLCSLSLVGQIVFLFLLAGLTDVYGQSTHKSGIYATIAMIFLYNAAYGWGITPLTVLYPPEVLSFDIRGVGMGIYTFTTKGAGLFITMVAPFGLDAIGYKMYIINACVDVLMLLYVVFVWVETRGLTLEEVDLKFEKVAPSKIIDAEDVAPQPPAPVTIGEKNTVTMDVLEGQDVVHRVSAGTDIKKADM